LFGLFVEVENCGVSLPANATSIISRARCRSDAKTAARPSLRRRSPSAAACARPSSVSGALFHPAARRAALSSDVECVS
jgi:hypothetical protein